MIRIVFLAAITLSVWWARPAPADACGVKVSVRAPGVKRSLVARRASPTPRAALVARRPIRVGPITRPNNSQPVASGGGSATAQVSADTSSEPAPTPSADTSAPSDSTDTGSDEATPPSRTRTRVAATDTKAPSDEETAVEERQPPRAPARTSGRAFERIFFHSGSASLSTEVRTRLQRGARWLQRHPTRSIIVEGHSSTTGKPEPNQVLSEARAQAVKAYLVDQGVDESRIETSAFGMTKPVYKPGTNPKNRRVIIRLRRR
jgi:OmpA-OmpF porin, OOP family